MTEEEWYWEYIPAVNQWHLHTPGYTPEISFKVGLQDGNMIAAFHKATTMPMGIREILAKMLVYLNLYVELEKGITKVIVSRGEVEKAAISVSRLRDHLERIDI